MQPRVSVGIPLRNEEERLSLLLDDLAAQAVVPARWWWPTTDADPAPWGGVGRGRRCSAALDHCLAPMAR
ncbi:hypothetical protein PO878_17315 [Iamia majanohamensis]|uniref:Uncharacterized protein n=1 Tax=Iamia majanohamensis TaxID=467976 RepID=A0AAF0BUN2_9ACTN|nr:hypothetical protein [Iamia majanohamensis]WCO66263.1 hypothetical protein PO878_17315 [Iamia majanohamensis]